MPDWQSKMDNRVVIRDACPERKAEFLYATYLNAAAEGFFRFMLGAAFREIIADAYLHTDSDYAFENVIFAERDNRIVGMACGYTTQQHRSHSSEPLERAAGFSIRMAIVKALFAPMLRMLDTLEVDDFYLQAIAVDEACRGQGVGSFLMDAIEARAIAAGARYLVLDVSARNSGARRMYERRGMEVVSRWPRRVFIPAISFFRMRQALR